jgi:hypothetical protein
MVAVSCGGSTPTTTPPTTNPAPPELQGAWVTVLQGTNEQVTLVLSETGYGVTRGVDHVGGAIAVHADQIEFSQASSGCVGTGVYSWSLTQGSLLFTLNSDPCVGRKEVLAGQTYKRP